jgi:hypothetical protein
MAAAAAITSITMKGGTSLRADAVTRRRALSSITSNFSREPWRPTRLVRAAIGGFLLTDRAAKRDLPRVDPSRPGP